MRSRLIEQAAQFDHRFLGHFGLGRGGILESFGAEREFLGELVGGGDCLGLDLAGAGVEAGLIMGMKKVRYNTHDYGSIVVTTHATNPAA
jgi:hypothetical protein